MAIHGNDPKNCPACETGKYNKPKRGTEVTRETLNDIQRSVLADLEKKVKAYDTNIANAKRKIDEYGRYVKQYQEVVAVQTTALDRVESEKASAQSALDAVRAAFGSTAQAGEFPQQAGLLYHLDSKTGGKGHFIEVDSNGNLKCSCTAGVFGNGCWAKTVIATNLRGGEVSPYFYPSNRSNFDARTRPSSSCFRVPGYATRRYSPYSTLR